VYFSVEVIFNNGIFYISVDIVMITYEDTEARSTRVLIVVFGRCILVCPQPKYSDKIQPQMTFVDFDAVFMGHQGAPGAATMCHT
jgi:hypothetical protein